MYLGFEMSRKEKTTKPLCFVAARTFKNFLGRWKKLQWTFGGVYSVDKQIQASVQGAALGRKCVQEHGIQEYWRKRWMGNKSFCW